MSFYLHTFVPNVFGQINKMCRLARHLNTQYQDDSYTKRVDRETTMWITTGVVVPDSARICQIWDHNGSGPEFSVVTNIISKCNA